MASTYIIWNIRTHSLDQIPDHNMKTEPSKSLRIVQFAVTPAASHPSRQP